MAHIRYAVSTVSTHKLCRHVRVGRHIVPETLAVSSAALRRAVPRPLGLASVDATASSPPPSCHVTRKPEVERDRWNIPDPTRRVNPARQQRQRSTTANPNRKQNKDGTCQTGSTITTLNKYFRFSSKYSNAFLSYASNCVTCPNLRLINAFTTMILYPQLQPQTN